MWIFLNFNLTKATICPTKRKISPPIFIVDVGTKRKVKSVSSFSQVFMFMDVNRIPVLHNTAILHNSITKTTENNRFPVCLGSKRRKPYSVRDPRCPGPVLWTTSGYKEDECGSHGQ